MATVTIKIDGEDPEKPGVGDDESVRHISRRESANRSVRRSRASSAIEHGTAENGDPNGVTSNRFSLRRPLSLENVFRFLGKGSKKSQSVKEHEPGLRSMLYGLDQKQQREEAAAKKIARKQKRGFAFQ